MLLKLTPTFPKLDSKSLEHTVELFSKQPSFAWRQSHYLTTYFVDEQAGWTLHTFFIITFYFFLPQNAKTETYGQFHQYFLSAVKRLLHMTFGIKGIIHFNGKPMYTSTNKLNFYLRPHHRHCLQKVVSLCLY